MEKRLVWQPILGVGGQLIGILLETEFADNCRASAVDDTLKKRCLDYVWSITKPRDWAKEYTPSNIISFDEGTMLPSLFQQYSDMGKWLQIENSSIHADEGIMFSFHHVGNLGDESANRWLQFLFSRWVQFMWI
jgi:hypothetical protein